MAETNMSSGLKRLEQVNVPDFRSTVFGYFDPETGEPIDISLERFHSNISTFQLHGNPPESVRAQFDLARNLLLYSWFVYEFSTPAEVNVYGAVELALREKFKTENVSVTSGRGLHKLFELAINHRWVLDGAFPFLFELQSGKKPTTDKGLEFSPDGTAYCLTLLGFLPKRRNHLAHGNYEVQMPHWPHGSFRDCACIIDALFPG